MLKTCIVCGKEFETNYPHQVTCGAECRREMKRRKARERGRKRYWAKPKVKITCRLCGKNFKDMGTENIAARSVSVEQEPKRTDMVNRSAGSVSMLYQTRKRERGAAGAEAVGISRWKAANIKKRLFRPVTETDTIPRR